MKKILYTHKHNIDYKDEATRKRILKIYDFSVDGYHNKGKAIFNYWNFVKEGMYVSCRGLLIEQSNDALKHKIQHFEKGKLFPGYVYAPYIPIQSYSKFESKGGEIEEWLDKDIEKTLKSRYIKKIVNNNYYGTVFPGEKISPNTFDEVLEEKDYPRKDLKHEKYEYEKNLTTKDIKAIQQVRELLKKKVN